MLGRERVSSRPLDRGVETTLQRKAYSVTAQPSWISSPAPMEKMR